ncbi:Gfo/Idh/MocA family protein [Mycobacterium intracellulare]|uniref:Putative dehydrogenase n=1 Tax=Mycobacterium intracellulare subsp. chimaera TaxID=222805 RepID=A0A7U5RZU2_MYCIT|nr:Gfo/Idh/MocA family oxidoreductase [Mycobacterium intracellulare]ASL18324.1 putative dehydrogenase [Mycobacterium intracellulare subsp. chimaera]
MNTAPVRLALIGLGNMGSAHLEIFTGLEPHARISALADSHAPFAERASAQVPAAAVFHDPLDCVNIADVDAVVVATADDIHYEIVQACIKRGLPVLCEKPLTTTAQQSQHVVRAERDTGRRLVQVGYMRRFDAGYQRMHRTLQAGLIGEPVLITQLHRNPLAVIEFDETELITSSASHDIDVFRWLTGDDIREVSAVSTASHDGSTVIVVLTLISRSGVIGVIELARGPGLNYEIGCDIVGANGTLSLPRVTDGTTADSIGAQGKPDAWMERFYEAYRAQDAAWLAAVSAQTFTGPSAYDGYVTNVVIDAALAARASGRTQSVLQEPEGS